MKVGERPQARKDRFRTSQPRLAAAESTSGRRRSRSQRSRITKVLAAQRKITDDLAQAQLAGQRRRADAARRLRDGAAAYAAGSAAAAATASACRGDDVPAAAVLRDADRDDLVTLAGEADAVTERLGACQRFIETVVSPGLGRRQ